MGMDIMRHSIAAGFILVSVSVVFICVSFLFSRLQKQVFTQALKTAKTVIYQVTLRRELTTQGWGF
jgi:hypothetical protein